MPSALQNPVTLWLLLTAALAGLVYAFMRPELRTKAILYGSFLLACAVAIWPPYGTDDGRPGKIHLGLDLRGGIHLVLQVVVDDALNATVDDAVNTARDQATRKGIQVASVQRTSPTTFSVEGIEPARVKDMRDLLRDFFRNGWEVRDTGEGKLGVADDGPVPAADEGPDGPGGDPHARAARQRARRRRAGHRGPGRAGGPDPRPAARRHRRRAGQARHQDDGPALAQARRELRGEPGDAPPGDRRQGARDDGGRHRPERHARPADLLPPAQGGDDHRPRSQERARGRRRVEPAADQLLAQRHGRRPLRPGDGAQHRPPARDRARQHGLLRPHDPGPARLGQPRSPAASPPRRPTSCRRSSRRARCRRRSSTCRS